MLTTVLWDVGGTLVDHVMKEEVFLARALVVAGIDPSSLSLQAVREADARRREREPSWRTPGEEARDRLELTAALLAGTGATEHQIAQVAKALGHYYELYGALPGIKELLRELDVRGIKQGVVSNWPPSLDAFLRHHELDRYFAVVVGSGAFGVAKPDPAIFRHALDRLGVTAGECLFIGDNPVNDVAPARQLGMQALHFDPRRRWEGADAREVRGLSLLIQQLV